MLNEEQLTYLLQQYEKAGSMLRTLTAKLRELTADLNKATQTINMQTDLIERLSNDNLSLAAKLDALTGRNTPGTGFAA